MENNSEREHKKSLGAKIHYFFVNTHSLNQWVRNLRSAWIFSSPLSHSRKY